MFNPAFIASELKCVEGAFARSPYSTKQVIFLYSLQLKTLGMPHHRNFRNLSACVVYIFCSYEKRNSRHFVFQSTFKVVKATCCNSQQEGRLSRLYNYSKYCTFNKPTLRGDCPNRGGIYRQQRSYCYRYYKQLRLYNNLRELSITIS